MGELDLAAAIGRVICGPQRRHRRTMARMESGPGRRRAAPTSQTGETRAGQLIAQRRRIHDEFRAGIVGADAEALRKILSAQFGV